MGRKRDKRSAGQATSTLEREPLLVAIAPAAALMLLAFVVYAPTLTAGFIWDDGRAITDNADLWVRGGLAHIWAGSHDFDYLPVKSSILWLVYQIFGASPAPYHVLNVAAHGTNAILLVKVLRRLEIPGAWLAGLVFLVHPTHVESVAWVSECKNTLSTLFALLSALEWLAFQRKGEARSYGGAMFFLLCGLLCKPEVVILPAALVLCWWWQRGRERRPAPELAGSTGSMASSGCAEPGRFFRAIAPLFLAATLLGLVAVWFQNHRAIAAFQLPVGNAASRVANAGKAMWWYLAKSVAPVHLWYEMPSRPIETMSEAMAVLAGNRPPNPAPAWPVGQLTWWPLCAIYRQWRVTPPVWYDLIPGAAMAALLVLVARRREGKGRALAFALGYFVLAMLPVLGLVKMSYMRAAWVADHFQYLADIGIIALGCGGATVLWRASGRRVRWVLGAVGVAVILTFTSATFARAAVFRTEYALWKDTLAKNPFSCQAHARFGAALLERKEFPAAVIQFQEEMRLCGEDDEVDNNLGLALVSSGQMEGGIAYLRSSIKLNDRSFFAHANLADVCAALGKLSEAASEYRAAIDRHPGTAALHFRLGTVLLRESEIDLALDSFAKAQALAPNNAEIAAALASTKRLTTRTP